MLVAIVLCLHCRRYIQSYFERTQHILSLGVWIVELRMVPILEVFCLVIQDQIDIILEKLGGNLFLEVLLILLVIGRHFYPTFKFSEVGFVFVEAIYLSHSGIAQRN